MRLWNTPALTLMMVAGFNPYDMPTRGSNTFLWVWVNPRGAPMNNALTNGSL